MTMEEHDDVKLESKGGGSIINHAPIFSPDGQYFFILYKNVIQSYNVETGEHVRNYAACDDTIIGAAIHPQNPLLLVACSSSGEIAIWSWQAQLLISKTKIKNVVDSVYSFHLLQPNLKFEQNDCKVILFYSKMINIDKIGMFSLKDFKHERDLPFFVNNKIICVQVGGANDCQFVAVLSKTDLFVSLLRKPKKVVKCRTRNNKYTCMAAHPEKDYVATGDNMGRILLWRGFSKSPPAKALYHWHTLPVNVLTFSHSGTYLYSGGNECVLVKWCINDLGRNYLPRLPAPIMHVTYAQGNTFMAISTKNNAIHIIDAQFKIRRVIQHLTWAVSHDAGIQVDYRTKSLVMNGFVGNIQFYSPHTKSLLYNLDVVGQNKLTEERNINISNTNVRKIALTKMGDWLACIEERNDREIYHEIRLKFFQFDETNQVFVLNTSIEYPHENGVNCLEFQPSTGSEFLCATTGNDAQFKIWNLVDIDNIYHKVRAWRCSSTANYKHLASNSLSFSSDGSLLAVAFGPCLTTWSPDSCDLKCSLVHPQFKETLLNVKFGNVNECHLVVAVSSERLCVWNLLTLMLVWTVPLKVTNICADPLSTYMAVFTDKQDLYVFSPGSSSPVFHKKQLTTDKNKIISAAFVPRITDYSGCLVWQRSSQLYFINSQQELLCLETETETSETNVLELTPQPQRSLFGILQAKTKSINNTKMNDSLIHKETGLTGAIEIKQLLQPPVHTMAPMRLLCNSVLRSFITRETNSAQSVIKEKEDSSEEEATPDSDVESDNTDKRITKRSSQPLKPKSKKLSKHKKDNLKSVLSEQITWTSILID